MFGRQQIMSIRICLLLPPQMDRSLASAQPPDLVVSQMR